MRTICVQIGNTDNKLPQGGWSNFILLTKSCIEVFGKIHFSGGSNFDEAFQNACFVFEIEEDRVAPLKQDLKRISEIFYQNSIAWLEGQVEFV